MVWRGGHPTDLGPRPSCLEPLPRRPQTLAVPLEDLVPAVPPKGAHLPLTLSRDHGGGEWRGRRLRLAGEELGAAVARRDLRRWEERRQSKRSGGTTVSSVDCGGEGRL
jgi:hypothetical protein